MTERVQIAVRVRPILDTDPADTELCVLKRDTRHIEVDGRRTFTVDRVFDTDEATEALYAELVRPAVDDFLAGYNATVMAYGQTGTGKTFTIQQLTPLVLHQIIEENLGGACGDLQYQYLEVYGEELRDLFSSNIAQSGKELRLYDNVATSSMPGGGVAKSSGARGATRDELELPERDGIGCYVSGAIRERCSSLAQATALLERGARARATALTAMNATSSRSHSVVTIYYDRYRSKLHLVDLAGSERNKKTKNVGQRFQESVGINTGLLALGNVIRAVARNSQHRGEPGTFPSLVGHVPYRSSKLTRLLQDALGGNSKTLLIACVAPDSSNKDETIRSLQYCCLAHKIFNEPTRDFRELCERREAARRRELLKRLNERLATEASARGHGTGSCCSGSSPNLTAIDADSGAAVTLAGAQAELEYLRQYCKEQDDEIATMRLQMQRVVAYAEVCERELRTDEETFAEQLRHLQALLTENAQLRRYRRDAEMLVSGPREVDDDDEQRGIYSAIPHVEAPSPMTDVLSAATVNSLQGVQRRRILDPTNISVSSETVLEANNPLHDAQSAQHSSFAKCVRHGDPTRFHVVDESAGSSSFDYYHSSGRPLAHRESHPDDNVYSRAPRMLRDISNANNNNDARLGSDGDSTTKDRDKRQLVVMTERVLEYQQQNSALRQQLSRAAAALKNEQRQTALLRMELSNIYQLLGEERKVTH